MLPTYRSGDLLLGWRWFRLRQGQVVVARTDRPIIKRVAQVTEDGVDLVGDNPTLSTDSRHFGPVHWEAIEALVIARIARGR